MRLLNFLNKSRSKSLSLKKTKDILNEGRSKSISLDTAVNTITKHCSDALKAYYKFDIIYRGIDSSQPYDYTFIDPKKYQRMSTNTMNYYTLINDNSPKWKKYPKRSRSIICTTSYITARVYGSVYVVFPYNGSKIGVCSKNDYWVSFPYLNKKLGYRTMEEFLEDLQALFDVDWIKNNIGAIDGYGLGDWTYLKNYFRDFDDLIKRADEEYIKSMKEDAEEMGEKFEEPDYSPTIEMMVDGGANILKLYDEYKSMEDMFNDLLDPKKNKFQLKKVGDTLPSADREVWTDGKSVLIQVENIQEIMKVINKNDN